MSVLFGCDGSRLNCYRGLDNAGKTTIVKKIMGEDVNSVSPTLGFIIKTIEVDGLLIQSCACWNIRADRAQVQAQHLYGLLDPKLAICCLLMRIARGRWRAENVEDVLEKLL